MAVEKEQFIKLLERLISKAMREVRRIHGEVLPGSVARRVAAQLWANTLLKAHANAGEWLRYVRGFTGLSQEEMVQQLGVALGLLQQWENGTALPSSEETARIEAFVKRQVFKLAG